MTTLDSRTGPASSFKLMLPQEWVRLDLNPETAEASVRAAVDAMVRADPGCADRQADVEELLSAMTRDAIADHALLSAVHFDIDKDGRPVQAAVSVTLRSVEGATDPDSIFERFDDGTVDGRITTTPSGPALRVRQRDDAGFMSWSLYVPVPGADGVVAVLSMLSPSVEEEERLDVFFDGLTDAFRFIGDEEAV